MFDEAVCDTVTRDEMIRMCIACTIRIPVEWGADEVEEERGRHRVGNAVT